MNDEQINLIAFTISMALGVVATVLVELLL